MFKFIKHKEEVKPKCNHDYILYAKSITYRGWNGCNLPTYDYKFVCKTCEKENYVNSFDLKCILDNYQCKEKKNTILGKEYNFPETEVHFKVLSTDTEETIYKGRFVSEVIALFKKPENEYGFGLDVTQINNIE